MAMEFTRNFTLEEKRCFAGHIGARGWIERAGRMFMTFVFFMGILSGICVWLEDEYVVIKKHQNAAVLLISLISLGPAIFFDKRGKYPPCSKRYVEELRNGKALVCQFEVEDALRVAEFEDSGYAFYLKLSDGRTLFLEGQYLYELVDRTKFPSRKIEVVFTAESKIVLGITCAGDYFPPSKELPAPSEEDMKKRRLPEDGSISKLNWRKLIEDGR